MAVALNGTPAISTRIVTPNQGVWFADIDLDLSAGGTVPSGKAVLTVGTSILNGTVDPRWSGRIGTKAKARLVGGGGGWDTLVSRLDFQNDAGVLSTIVLSATAAEVGEIVTELGAPSRLGSNYVRTAGPASRVLAGLSWYVTAAGITIVGPRIPTPADPTSVVLLDWEPSEKRALIATDDVLSPGTILVDPRLGTDPIIVQDVEQLFTQDGSRTTAYCGLETTLSPIGNRLMNALAAIAIEKTRAPYLKTYLYRVVLQGPDDRLTLQAVRRTAGIPDAFPISMVPGVPGTSAKLAPGGVVLVVFAEGDPGQPMVIAFQSGAVLELDIDALLVKFGEGTQPVAKATSVIAALQGILTAVGSCPGLNPAGVTAANTAILTIASTKLVTD